MQHHTTCEDRALILNVAAGDHAARNRLAARANPAIRARVARVLRRLTPAWVDDTADITQQVWLVLLKDGARQLLAFDPARGITLEAYVAMVAEREVRNHIACGAAAKRGADRKVTLSDERLAAVASPMATPEQTLVANDLARGLVDALAENFPERAQSVLRRCFGEDETPEEAARHLEMPTQQVYNWLFRLRKTSRAYFEAAAAAA